MEFVELIKAIILGIIEGITEWLPISSTGHMILADEFIKLNVTEGFKEMFFVVIQLGAILAVVILYFRKLNPLLPSKTMVEKKETLSIWLKVGVGVLPAAIIGVLLDDWLDKHFYNYMTVSITLIVYGILFIIIESRNKKRVLEIIDFSKLTYSTAIAIGLFQVLSLIPGTSRSGATILGGILLGCSRKIAAEYSFFMSIPIMFGASGLKLLKFGFNFTPSEVAILVAGLVVAFGVSVLAIKLLMRYIRNNDFKVFGWYRIVLGITILAYFLVR